MASSMSSWGSRPLNSAAASAGGAEEGPEAEAAGLVASEREDLEAEAPSLAASARDAVSPTSSDARSSSSRGLRFASSLLVGALAGVLLTALARIVRPSRWLSEETGLQPLSLAEAGPTGDRLLCFSVSMVEGYELKLIRAQYKENASIFACDKFVVFSLESFSIAKGVETVAIPGAPARWDPNSVGTKVFNTNVFLRAWGKIRDAGTYKHVDWVVKADVDAVFFPARLKQEFVKDEWTWVTKWDGAVFIKNCLKWNSMQGPLEILSRKAVATFLDQMDVCKQTIPIDSSGEDQFLDQCLEQLGLQGVGAFGLVNDYYCDGMPAPCDCANGQHPKASAYHPCKSRKTYFECHRAAQEL